MGDASEKAALAASAAEDKLKAAQQKQREEVKHLKAQIAKYESVISKLQSLQEAKKGAKSDKKLLAESRD